MSKAPAKPRNDPGLDALSFEQALEQVESIISRVESGDVGLEQSLAEYERGVKLINHCRAKLNRAQVQIEDLTRKLDGAADADDTEVTDRSIGRRDGSAPPEDDDEELPV